MSLAEQEQRWQTGKHVGAAKPTFKGYVRRGHLERHFRNRLARDVFAFTPGLGGPHSVWYAEWTPDEDYVEIPNILSAKGDLDFDQKGVENVTIEIDNVVMVEQSGLSGLFHEIDRGHMSPLRGQAEFNSEVVGTANSWQNKWRQSATQIMLLAGYGEAYFPLFLGLIDDCDITSQPDRITVTARNMGKLLTDQRTFMDAKNLFIRDPITFCDRQQADRLTDVARTARAKSTNGSHPARFVLDGDDDTAWVSERHGNSDELEWIEVQVPNARIEDLEIFPGAAGMEMYFSVYATNTRVPGGGRARRTDGTVVGEGWVNEGLGSVPGTSIPFTYQIGTAKEKANRYAIKQGGGGYLVGDDSKVRIWFRRLAQIRVPSIRYHAAVRTLKVFDRKLQQAAKQNHWILVDDVSDIVKVVLQWTGFTDWEVETVGVRLSDKLVFDRQNFLIDIIWKLAEMTSYVFYVKPPDSFDQGNLAKGNVANLSTGVAVFRQNNAMRSSPIDKRYLVRDESLLTGIQPRFTNEPLADSIRVRGRTVAKEKQKNNPNVHPLGADRLRRYQYSYRPVWARSGDFRFGNVRKPVVHYEEQINSVYLAKVTCLLIAFRQALEAATAQAQFPLFPPIYLDHQIVLRDSSSALSTRLWVASRAWEYRGGEQVTFSMTVAGSLLDVPDTKDTVEELRQVLNTRGFDPAPIARGPWTEPRFF